MFMECKFLRNGIAIQYHDVVTPCCVWKSDNQWAQSHTLHNINFETWHEHPDMVATRDMLKSGEWPDSCISCKIFEDAGRGDSMRLNGLRAYNEFSDSDITLEIRPGSVCNFACQTCWTSASSRVAHFYEKAGIADGTVPGLKSVDVNTEKNNLTDFSFLNSIRHRLKNVVILGGEPFYDPKCLDFLEWCVTNTSSELMMFTNGSMIDFDILQKTKKKTTLVFSIDATSDAAEYIRYGTDWGVVLKNFEKCRDMENIEIRVHITISPYSIYYVPDILNMLSSNWPSVVSFGEPDDPKFSKSIIPPSLRPKMIDRLELCISNLSIANIEEGQKSNAMNALKSTIDSLSHSIYDANLHREFIDFVHKMDKVKNMNLVDKCPEISDLLVVSETTW